MIRIYTQEAIANSWLAQYKGKKPLFACILGFTQTGLIPGISAAGATPQDRQYTAIADAEFLLNGVQSQPTYALPPLTVGASPVFISRAIVEAFNLPVYLFNAGLPHPPAVPTIDLGGIAAQCLSSGQALPLTVVKQLWEVGLTWGETLAQKATESYLILSECVVGGTTTALGILTALGIQATGKVNSSHPHCNHAQKWELVSRGLTCSGFLCSSNADIVDPFAVIAAVGDPMQIVVAGMAIAASRRCGVLLAGGTQMLAVSALMQALARFHNLDYRPEHIVVGTTRWVATDPTGDTVGLAKTVGNIPLLATNLNFTASRYPQLQAYEQGFVKEGVGAGGAAIAAHLLGWNSRQILKEIEALLDRYRQKTPLGMDSPR